MEGIRMNISAPNLVNACFDSVTETEKRGRMYSCYKKEAEYFSNELQLLKLMERLMDQLRYPQSSMDARTYGVGTREHQGEKPLKVVSQEEIMKERGTRGSFVIHVQYRQNATWQGRLIHMESGKVIEFRSVLELLKIFDEEL